MTRKLSPKEMLHGGKKYFTYLASGGLFNINLEVTKRCNARCDFCDYWKEAPGRELTDYVPVVRALDPLSVSLTGGEPLLRKDLDQIITRLRKNFNFLHISLINNGSLLSFKRGLQLWNAGLDELSVSLDYLDERHDKERHLPGLTQKILTVVPRLKTAGVNMCFNIVIKQGNFLEVPQMLRQISAMGIKVSVSTYNGWRIGNERHMIRRQELPRLRQIISEIKALKNDFDTITTGDYYLDRIPEFVEKKGVSGCSAGRNWVQVTPDGMIKRCSDHPVAGHFSEWKTSFFTPTACDRCWYSCRGAAQEPWTLKRFTEMAKDALFD
jgi:MoaA/NifB/PqqE/SkfB family radical SAM enzyme